MLIRNFPAVAVTGARQTGKTTLLKEMFGKRMKSVTFDPSIDVANARRDPDLFLDNNPPPLILDEIQYAPELIAAIKRRIDRNPGSGQYLMTGSQRWGVIRNMAESMAGRIAFLELEGFCMLELASGDVSPAARGWVAELLSRGDGIAGWESWKAGKRKRTLAEQLWRGFLPRAQFAEAEAIPALYAGYRQTYIERDVRMMADLADLQEFGRFYNLAMALTAQEINMAHMGREMGVTRRTAERWLTLLRESCQWFETPSFSGNATKRLSGKPKGYVADTGLACAGQVIGTPEAILSHPLFGALFETAVVGEIRRQCAALPSQPAMYHWRTAGGAEVDLVLEYDGVLYPIEIKASTRINGYDTRGILAFRKTYEGRRIARGLLLAPIEQPIQLHEYVTALPWDASAHR